MTTEQAALTEPLNEEDQARAHMYGLIAALLIRPPGAELIEAIRGIRADDAHEGPMRAAWAMLQQSAAQAKAEALADEYQELFIGVGRGELMPYGSWYMTGFLMEKPLAELRGDLRRLGFERQEQVHEPEDHAAALCETMSLIITSGLTSGAEMPFEQQREFFSKHMAPWMGRFFADLGKARSARFYRAVGLLGEQFFEVERTYLAMPV